MEKLIDHCKKPLAENGLGYIQTNTSTEDGKIGITTRLIHDSGEWVEDTMTANLYKLAKMNEYQVAGSIITYFRRYALASMLGIASDEDIDASGEQEVQQEVFKPCNATQVEMITNLLNTKNVDVDKFMVAYKILDVSELSFTNAGKAIMQLQKKTNRS